MPLKNPYPRLYRETARHPDNLALLNAIGLSLLRINDPTPKPTPRRNLDGLYPGEKREER